MGRRVASRAVTLALCSRFGAKGAMVLPRLALPLALGLLLSACGSGGSAVKSTSAPAKASKPVPIRPAMRAPAQVAPPKPRILSVPGLEGVIGAGPDALQRQFGPARLDVWEGDARKLQFAGRACVLDVFLYPTDSAANVTATHVEARRPSDGQDVDRAACVASLRGK